MYKNLTVAGQYGTHIDAPIHLLKVAVADEIDLKDLPCHSTLSTSLKEVAVNSNLLSWANKIS